jgi:SAM-dependent methyltransferase
MMLNKPLVILGLPSVGHHSTLFTNSLRAMAFPNLMQWEDCCIVGDNVDRARNLICHYAITRGAKYLCFLDEDVIAPPNSFTELLYQMENHPEIDVLNGVYSTKSYPPTPLVYKEWGAGPYYGWKLGELFQVKSAGMGLTVIRVASLQKMDVDVYDDAWPTGEICQNVRRYFFEGYTYDEEGNSIFWSEDQYFYKRADEAGLSVWVDGRIIAQHYNERDKRLYLVPFDSYICKPLDAWAHKPRVANLGCGADIRPWEVNVDLYVDAPGVFKADVRRLPEEWGGQFDVVRAKHVLEHFPYEQTKPILREWARLLAPGGRLVITVPDIEFTAKRILETGRIDVLDAGNLWGDQGHPLYRQHPYPANAHLSGFTAAMLRDLLEGWLGLTVEVEEHHGLDFTLEAVKPVLSEAQQDGHHPGENEELLDLPNEPVPSTVLGGG